MGQCTRVGRPNEEEDVWAARLWWQDEVCLLVKSKKVIDLLRLGIVLYGHIKHAESTVEVKCGARCDVQLTVIVSANFWQLIWSPGS